jgi:ABC-type amino acid transport substrate-binding protein
MKMSAFHRIPNPGPFPFAMRSPVGRSCHIAHKDRHAGLVLVIAFFASILFSAAVPVSAGETAIRYFPVGPIYEYRWKLLELALARTTNGDAPLQLVPFAEDVTQNRGMQLLQSGAIDVIALGTNDERESRMRPIKIDILRGIVGFRIFVIRAADQARIARLDDQALRQQLTFGLNSQWADLPIMRANGFTVETSPSYENLFGMLVAGRFDAFPRGLNEAGRELDERKQAYPQLAVERSKALFFPYPVYFWVSKENTALAQRIERGLKLALADGSFRKLFETYHATEITLLAKEKRQVMRLDNPTLPAGTTATDTSWWWH